MVKDTKPAGVTGATGGGGDTGASGASGEASKTASLPTFEPAKTYSVKVKQVVTLPGADHHMLRPGDVQNILSGEVCEQIKAFIETAEEVA